MFAEECIAAEQPAKPDAERCAEHPDRRFAGEHSLDDGDIPTFARSRGFAVEAIDVIRVSHVDIDFDAEFFDEGFAFRGDVPF